MLNRYLQYLSSNPISYNKKSLNNNSLGFVNDELRI